MEQVTYPVDNLQSLALHNLSPLQRLFNPLRRLAVQRLSASDNHLELAAVGRHQGRKVGKDLGGRGEAAVLGQDREEVGEDGRGGGREDGGERLGAGGSGQSGVFCGCQ